MRVLELPGRADQWLQLMVKKLRTLLSDIHSSHAIKLAVSLTLLVMSMLFIADILKLRGDPILERQTARRLIAESLAVQLSTLASVAEAPALQHALSEFVRRNDVALAASLNRASGTVLAQNGNLDLLNKLDNRSTISYMVVPIYEGVSTWGNLHIAFRPLTQISTDLAYFSFLIGGTFLVFLVFLRRALLQLDPSRAVPGRVNSAFNLFSEGVIILDNNLRIMLSNQAAARMIKLSPNGLVGKQLDDWPWIKDKTWRAPWATALHTGMGISEHSLYLGDKGVERMIVVSCTLVGEEDPTRSGVMVTLNDMSAMQKKNRDLSVMLNQLKKSQESISEKNRELEVLAWLDPLTGLLNRRKLIEQFENQLETSVRQSTPLICLMLDIDHFKAINDTYGHGIGDEVICAVAATMKLVTREQDIVGRYGGEEFVVIMPDTNERDGLAMAERLREAVHALSTDITVPVSKLSASFGISEYQSETDTVDLKELLERADQALYAAKEAGRNRVVAYDPDTLKLLAASSAANEDEFSGEDGVSVNSDDLPKAPVAKSETELSPPTTQSGSQAPASRSAQADAVQAMVYKHKEEVEMLLSHDVLTQLPRRQLFMHAVESEILRADRLQRSMGIVSIEIKDLKRLTSSLGHQQCESLIKNIINRIQDDLRASDIVTQINEAHSISHLTENDYGILLSDLAEPDHALPVITRMRRLLLDPVIVDGEKIYPGFNIGVALYPQCGSSGPDLLESAIGARLEAAEQPEKVAYFFASSDMEKLSREYLQLESDLYSAVEERAFEVYFQPKFDLTKRSIKSAEALIRWNHPTRGFVPPDKFILVAETNGLIRSIFHQVLEASLAQIVEWDKLSVAEMSVSVNLSASQLRDSGLVSHILTACKDAGLAPHRLEIELTETSIIQSPQRARVALGQLHDAGVSISMDDFGTGYTSLALLAELPLDAVKIDRSFIVAMQTSERSRAIVESVINMAHTLRLLVVAEGVETSEQLTTLDLLGCNEVQGYLISRPLPGQEITTLLEREASNNVEYRQA